MPLTYYSNTATQTTLGGNISSGATTMTVGSTAGFPTSYPYTLAVDYGAGAEELVSVTAAAGMALTIVRGFSGTSAQSHSLGAVVRHVWHAGDATDFRTHENTSAGAHGVSGSLVGTTQTQTLTNKTLTNPTINNAALSGTFTGAPTLTGGLTLTGSSHLVERALPTDNAYRARMTGDVNSRFLINADGTLIWGSGGGTGDTNLYREGPSQLATDDVLRVYRPTASDSAVAVRVTGDTSSRWQAVASGELTWGPGGAAAADTNLYRSSANVLATDDDFQVGGRLFVQGVGNTREAYKTTDTSRANTTTMTADPHLSVLVSANAVYTLEGVLLYTSASVTPDFQVAVTGPSSVDGSWTLIASSAGSTSDPDAVRTIATDIGSGRGFGVPLAGVVFGGRLFGTVATGGTSGTVGVNWSQFTSNATATVLRKFSWIRLTRIA
ncbi:hypothetical protein ACIOHE_26340 [Streptomyces sp. NPDC087851]|uniref:hypothetical protein n=1 Tax=Streptomyces sp. NPDC087851 TaxID=3365810 RepID=UPI003803272F